MTAAAPAGGTPRTIAYLTSHYARAGDTFIRREVEELRRRGWTVHTFSIRRADEGEQVSGEILREQRTTDYVLERGPWLLAASFLRTLLRAPLRMLRAIRQAGETRSPGLRSLLWHGIYLLEASYLAERLRRLRVSLLHNHIAMSSGTVAMLASTLSGVPFSMTVHGLELLSAETWALGRKVRASALTACISSYGKAQCMLFSAPEDWPKLHIVRCGLDAEFLDAAPTPPVEAMRLVCVGRLSPEKGQTLLVEAVALLRDEGVHAEVVLVGDGPSRQEIERRARELGIEERIVLAGWRSSAEVRRFISESRALVVPSLSEGIPVVLMEAMALRKPAVATQVGGIPELLTPECGWLTPAGSPRDLASAMRQALSASPGELERRGEAGRKRVVALHHLSEEVGKLAALFEGAIAS